MRELRGLARHAKESSCAGSGLERRARTRKPRLTANVLEGIIAATSQVLAGPEDGECEADWADIERARAWAFDMRAHRGQS